MYLIDKLLKVVESLNIIFLLRFPLDLISYFLSKIVELDCKRMSDGRLHWVLQSK